MRNLKLIKKKVLVTADDPSVLTSVRLVLDWSLKAEGWKTLKLIKKDLTLRRIPILMSSVMEDLAPEA